MKKIIERAPFFIKKVLLKLGYLRNGARMTDYIKKGNYHIYHVDGWYVPSDSLGWYVRPATLKEQTDKICFFKYKPKKGDVVMDIGAGLGEESLVASHLVGDTGKVYAIEANPTVYDILTTIISLNGLQNIAPFHVALNNENSPIVLEEDDSFLSGALQPLSSAHKKQYTVEGIRFEDFLAKQGITHIDYLKSNIEGAERYLIDALERKLPSINHLAIACHDFRWKTEGVEFFKTKQIVIDFLQKHNYEVFVQNTGIGNIDDWVYGTKV